MKTSLSTLARAKVNLGLEVLGRRPDGYHEVRTVLATISLADRLEAEAAEALAVRSTRPDLGGESDLVYRAARVLLAAAGRGGGAVLRVEKRIPVAAGLGGGASDAAATLRLLRRLLRLNLTEPDLCRLAARLGADVPFFLRGGVALAAGRGDRLEPLPNLPPWPVLVALDREGPADKTRRAYGALGPGHWSSGEGVLRLAERLIRGGWSADEPPPNAFDAVAEALYPGIGELKARLHRAGARWASLAGAGPAIFTVEPDPDRARAIARTLRAGGTQVFLCRFTPRRQRL